MSLTDYSIKSLSIVSGAPNVTFDGTNKFTLQLPQNGLKTDKYEIALKSLSIYNSFYNISAAKSNNTYSYLWSNTAFNVTIPDGIWSFSDFRSFHRKVMISNGHYLLDNSVLGGYVYFMDIALNPNLYCLSLTCSPPPLSLPAGYTNPANLDLAAVNGYVPRLVIPATNFATFTGFTAGTYPSSAQNTLYQVNSGVPQVSTSTSFNLISNIVDSSNSLSLAPSVLHNFVLTDGLKAGSLFTKEPYGLDWMSVSPMQTFNTITVALVDQLYRPVKIQDPSSFVLILNLRKKRTLENY